MLDEDFSKPGLLISCYLMVILYPNLYNTIINTNFIKVAFFETIKTGYNRNPVKINLNTFDSQ
jgi:hypothetical protein